MSPTPAQVGERLSQGTAGDRTTMDKMADSFVEGFQEARGGMAVEWHIEMWFEGTKLFDRYTGDGAEVQKATADAIHHGPGVRLQITASAPGDKVVVEDDEDVIDGEVVEETSD